MRKRAGEHDPARLQIGIDRRQLVDQLCDAPALRPATNEAIIQEARAMRLPPGHGELPLAELLAELPDDVVLSVEVPMKNDEPPEVRARQIFDATRELLRSCGNK